MKVETVRLEDNQEYVILDTILVDDTKYIYLSLLEDENDFCVRKFSENDQEIVGLQSEKELQIALQAFWRKHPIN